MSIQAKKIKQAYEDAKRFIKSVEVVYSKCELRKYERLDSEYDGGQYCAAMKRASMDLSKSLAALRKTQ